MKRKRQNVPGYRLNRRLKENAKKLRQQKKQDKKQKLRLKGSVRKQKKQKD